MKYVLLYISLFIATIWLFIWSLTLGPIHIPINKIIDLIRHPEATLEWRIIYETRLPRALIGVLTGSCLAIAGVILQYVTRNLMACPSLLGINQGAQLGILLILITAPFTQLPIVILYALVGGAVAGLVTYLLVYSMGVSALKLVLVGQAINALLYAISLSLIILFPQKSGVILVNINGSLAGSSWQSFHTVAPILFIAIIACYVYIKKIHILSLGEEIATSLGINIKWLLAIAFIIVTSLCSLSVSLVGQILFFPLIAVNFSKIILKSNSPFHLLIVAMFIGAILMTLSDCLMRYIYIDQEVPIGIFMSLIGAPVLVLCARIKQ
ncbi:MAG: iron ABC transporter permease [Burkholderiales bacterium]|nr:iron ABC transporter permease [Burkholderiales bacterium]